MATRELTRLPHHSPGLLLLLPVMRHPRVPLESPLSRGRIAFGLAGALIFLLTFTPTPFRNASLLQLLR